MIKKIIVALILINFVSISFAETCPTVSDIKQNRLAGWKVYDSEDDKPLPPKRAASFIASVDQFILAEWSNRSKKKQYDSLFLSRYQRLGSRGLSHQR